MISLLANPNQIGHAAGGHPERPQRVTAILDAIAKSGLDLTPEQSSPASEQSIATVHDRAYVAMLDRMGVRGGYLDPDTYITAQSMAAARSAAGAVVEGVRRVLDGTALHAFAVVRPPGHHAEHARAMGFCLLNNIAIGLMEARARNLRRIAILDFDVHHGNGTQHSFQSDADVFYASTHQYPFYPGTGAAGEHGAHGTVLNVPLAAGSGDREFIGAWEKKIGPALDGFRPEFLLVSAGFDAHRSDPLAGLEVSTEGYRRLAELIASWSAEHARGRSVWVLEGGYDLDTLGSSVVACLDVLRLTTQRDPRVDSGADQGYNGGSPD